MTDKQQLVSNLLNTAYRDSELLTIRDEQGDIFSIPRNIDFCLSCSSEKQAETVASFINDNRYGEARVESEGGNYRILVVSEIPPQQNIVGSMSALMQCVAFLFSVEYLGWGGAIETGS